MSIIQSYILSLPEDITELRFLLHTHTMYIAARSTSLTCYEVHRALRTGNMKCKDGHIFFCTCLLLKTNICLSDQLTFSPDYSDVFLSSSISSLYSELKPLSQR